MPFFALLVWESCINVCSGMFGVVVALVALTPPLTCGQICAQRLNLHLCHLRT